MGQRQGKFPPKHIFFKNLLGWSFPSAKEYKTLRSQSVIYHI